MVYAAQFSKWTGGDGQFIAAGGSDPNEIHIFDRMNGYESLYSVNNLDSGVYELDFSPNEDKFAAGGGVGPIQIIDIVR